MKADFRWPSSTPSGCLLASLRSSSTSTRCTAPIGALGGALAGGSAGRTTQVVTILSLRFRPSSNVSRRKPEHASRAVVAVLGDLDAAFAVFVEGDLFLEVGRGPQAGMAAGAQGGVLAAMVDDQHEGIAGLAQGTAGRDEGAHVVGRVLVADHGAGEGVDHDHGHVAVLAVVTLVTSSTSSAVLPLSRSTEACTISSGSCSTPWWRFHAHTRRLTLSGLSAAM